MNTKALLSDVSYVRLSLAESTGDRVKVRGEFAKCGVATENKRVYPKPVWEKEIKRLNKALKERRVFGEVDHPSDGQTKLARVSHIVTELRVEDGLVVGEAEVLPTDSGRNLLALLKANIPVGVSSRGFGSVKSNDKGEDIVQEDYKLVTFDFVADPADVDAFPQVSESRGLFEGVEFDADDEQEKAIEFARRIEAERSNKPAVTETTREAISREILTSLAALRSEVREEVRQEILADPSIAGAKAALESVKEILRPYVLPEDVNAVVSAKDTEIHNLQKEVAEHALRVKTLEEENTSLASMAKEVGYRFYLERILSNDPHAESIRNLVGDVKAFANSDELKARVEQVKAEFSRHVPTPEATTETGGEQAVAEAKEREAELQRAFDAKLAEIERRVADSEQERAELIAELDAVRAENKELAASNRELETKIYAEERLANHPKAAKLRSLAERVNVSSKKEVDALLESAREPVRDSEDLQEIRARIRSRVRGGSERAPEEISEARAIRSGKNGVSENYQGLGISLDSLRRLSGITEKQ